MGILLNLTKQQRIQGSLEKWLTPGLVQGKGNTSWEHLLVPETRKWPSKDGWGWYLLERQSCWPEGVSRTGGASAER